MLVKGAQMCIMHGFMNISSLSWLVWTIWTPISAVPKKDVNSSPPGQNGRHFPDDIFKCIFMNEKFCIFIQISLKFFLRSNQQYSSIGSENGLAPIRRQDIICTNAPPVHWRIYAALGGDEWNLNCHSSLSMSYDFISMSWCTVCI